jgi:hypothetical protein
MSDELDKEKSENHTMDAVHLLRALVGRQNCIRRGPTRARHIRRATVSHAHR